MRNEIIKGMSNHDYHAHDGLSNSRMSTLLDCPARYYAENIDPNREIKETPEHYKIGSAVHTLVLEPDLFWLENYVMPKCDGRTTKGKEEKLIHQGMSAGKRILDEKQYEKAKSMADSVLTRVKWLKSFLKSACIEESLFWVDDETGIQLKSRPDIYNEDFYIDLKTTSRLNKRTYSNSVVEYGYHRQSAMAKEALYKLHGVKYNYFMHIIIEESYPYLTSCCMLDEEYIQKGDAEFREAAKIYKKCIETNEWPGYENENKIEMIYMPNWYK